VAEEKNSCLTAVVNSRHVSQAPTAGLPLSVLGIHTDEISYIDQCKLDVSNAGKDSPELLHPDEPILHGETEWA